MLVWVVMNQHVQLVIRIIYAIHVINMMGLGTLGNKIIIALSAWIIL
jgi:hypothetical protein